MPISRSVRAIALAACCVALAGCEGDPAALGFLDGTVPQTKGPAPVRETVLAETVRISAPSGYCVDSASRRNGLVGAFVVLAPCAALKVEGIDWPQTVAVMTVSATRGALPAASTDELEAFVTSAQGRSLLSTKDDSTVEVLQTESDAGSFFVRVAEADAPVAALEGTYWRGLVAAGGRLVSVTVRGYDAEPLSAAVGLRMIRRLASDIRAQSKAPEAETPT